MSGSNRSGSKFLGLPSKKTVLATAIEVAEDAASAAAGAGLVILAQKLNGYFGTIPAAEMQDMLTKNITWLCQGLPLLKTSALEGALPGVGVVALTTLLLYMLVRVGMEVCGERAKYIVIIEEGEAAPAADKEDTSKLKAICGKPNSETVKAGTWLVCKNTLFAAGGAGAVIGAQAIDGAFRTKQAFEVGSEWMCNGIDFLKVTLAYGLGTGEGGAVVLALILSALAAWNARSQNPRLPVDSNLELPGTPREDERICGCG